MRAKDLFTTSNSANVGSIMVEALFEYKARVTGCSTPVGCQLGVRVNRFSILTSKEKGLVAVTVEKIYDKRTAKDFGFLIQFDSTGIELEHPWQPTGDRFGDVDDQGIITVVIGGQKYSSAKRDYCKMEGSLVDGNLLCKYLIGEVEADAVKAAAEAHLAELSAVDKLSEAEARVRNLEADLRLSRSENFTHNGEHQTLRGQIDQLITDLKNRWVPLVNRKKILDRLQEAMGYQLLDSE